MVEPEEIKDEAKSFSSKSIKKPVAAMKILILGGTGATGRLLVKQLLEKDQNVVAIVRSKEKLLEECLGNFAVDSTKLSVIEGTFLEMSDDEAKASIHGCDAVVSCLGHNLTMKGIYGKPRKVVRDSIKRVCDIIQKEQNSPESKKLILMGSEGVANPDGSDDVRSIGDRILLGLLRLLVPPVVDNEAATQYLCEVVGKHTPQVQWTIVRPSELIDADVSRYEIVPKPNGSLFGAAETSRANATAFMCELILQEKSWNEWLFKLPVVVNSKTEQAPPQK